MTSPVTPNPGIHTVPTAQTNARAAAAAELQLLKGMFGNLPRDILIGMVNSILNALGLSALDAPIDALLEGLGNGFSSINIGNIFGLKELIQSVITLVSGVIQNLINVFSIEQLQTVWQTLETSLGAVDWLRPLEIFGAFVDVERFAVNLIKWFIQVTQNLLALIGVSFDNSPWAAYFQNFKTKLALSELRQANATYRNDLLTIDWTLWDIFPDAWTALSFTVTYIHAIFHWFRDVFLNFTGIDLSLIVALFDWPDLRSAISTYRTSLLSIDWSLWDLVPDFKDAVTYTVTFVHSFLQWVRTVVNNIFGVDFGKIVAVFDWPDLRTAISTYREALQAINWLALGGGLAFMQATAAFFRAVGNWLLTVIHNFWQFETTGIHNIFSSVQSFISNIILLAFGPSGEQAWQNALDFFSGVENSAPWQAVIRVYQQLRDFLSHFNIPDLASLQAWFDKLTSGGIRGILSAFNLTGQIRLPQIPLIPVSHIVNINPELLWSADFSDSTSISGSTGFVWDGTVGHTSLGSAKATADGQKMQLMGNSVPVIPTENLDLSVWTEWSGVTTSGSSPAPISLQLQGWFDGAPVSATIIQGVASPGASSTWVQLSGTFQVPLGVDTVYLALVVDSTCTAGSVWFDDASVQKAGLLAGGNTLVQHAESVLTSLFGSNSIGSQVLHTLLPSGQGLATLGDDVQGIIDHVANALNITGTGHGLSTILTALGNIPYGNLGSILGLGNLGADIQGIVDHIGNSLGLTGSNHTLAAMATSLTTIPFDNITSILGSAHLGEDVQGIVDHLSNALGQAGSNHSLANLASYFTNIPNTNIASQLGGLNLGSDVQSIVDGVVKSFNGFTGGGFGVTDMTTFLQNLNNNLFGSPTHILPPSGAQFQYSALPHIILGSAVYDIQGGIQGFMDGLATSVNQATGQNLSTIGGILQNIPGVNVLGAASTTAGDHQALWDAILNGFNGTSGSGHAGIQDVHNLMAAIANRLPNSLGTYVFTASQTGVLVPATTTHIDFIVLGGGGGGAGGSVVNHGNGGSAGSFNSTTLSSGFTAGTTTYNVNVGAGGAGGTTPGNSGTGGSATSVTTSGGSTVVSASGGAGGVGVAGSFTGASPGTTTVNSIVYTGGAAQTISGGHGISSGGGGGGGNIGYSLGPGGAGASGAVWIRFY